MLMTVIGTLAIVAILAMLIAMARYAAAMMRAGRPVTRLGAEVHRHERDRRAKTDQLVA